MKSKKILCVIVFSFAALFARDKAVFSQQVPVGEATIILQGIGEFKITQIQFTNVSPDMILNKGDEFVVQSVISGTGTGSFSYGWYLDGVLRTSGTAQMTSGQSVTLSSPKDFIATDMEGITHTVYLKFTIPNELQSDVVSYKVQSAASLLPGIVLTAPAGGDMMNNDFSWDAAGGVSSYKIAIGKNASLSGATVYTTFENRFRYPKDAVMFKHGDTVYWQVKAYGPGDTLLAQSKAESFVNQNEIVALVDELSQLPEGEGTCENDKIVNFFKKQNKEKKEKYKKALPKYKKLEELCKQGQINPVTGTPVCEIVKKYVFVPDFAKKINDWDEDVKKWENEKATCKDLEDCMKGVGNEK